MTRIHINAFRQSGELLEIYWLAGFELSETMGWRVRVVTLGLDSKRIAAWWLPVGYLPSLSLGLRFDATGQWLETQSAGEIRSVTLHNLRDGEEVTSAEMPRSLRPEFCGQMGVQRLFRFSTSECTVLVPAVELVRYLFAHSKTLANALMVPGQLLTLYQYEPIGIHGDLTIRFLRDTPVRTVTRDYVREFVWLAVDPEGRRSWDSVYRRSVGHPFVSLDPPDVPNAAMMFRGIRDGNTWLVFEILHLAGRVLPCEALHYSHPGFRWGSARGRTGVESGSEAGRGDLQHGETEVVIYDGGSRISAGQTARDAGFKFSEFGGQVPVEKTWVESQVADKRLAGGAFTDEQARMRRVKGGTGNPADSLALTRRVGGSLDREAQGSSLQPIELRTLQSHSWDAVEGVQAFAKTMSILATLLADTEVSMSLCRLKAGRAFSVVGRGPRCCVVVHVRVAQQAPLVLLDVDRSGGWALATLAVSFSRPLSLPCLEGYVKTILDRLVDRGGRWDGSLEGELRGVCAFLRLPKVLANRDTNSASGYKARWARRIAHELRLPLIK